MVQISSLSFSIQPFEDVSAVIPVVAGTPLPEMISAFEHEKHYEPAGGYGGLIPQYFNYGPLDRYFFGDFDDGSYFARMGRIYVLGCECGEVGCWPLVARVKVDEDSVVWDSFQQPHRPGRDYADFGSFVFKRRLYRHAVADLMAGLASR